MANPFTTLPQVGDLFVVDATGSQNYTHSSGQIMSSQVEPGLYIAIRVDAVNNVAYGGLVTGGAPGKVPQSTSGEIGIPLSRIRQVYAAR
jgi:hypothetical protein